MYIEVTIHHLDRCDQTGLLRYLSSVYIENIFDFVLLAVYTLINCNLFLRKPGRVIIIEVSIDGFNYRVWHYKNNHITKTGSHFVVVRRS